MCIQHYTFPVQITTTLKGAKEIHIYNKIADSNGPELSERETANVMRDILCMG